jgi:hypothetical protein
MSYTRLKRTILLPKVLKICNVKTQKLNILKTHLTLILNTLPEGAKA